MCAKLLQLCLTLCNPMDYIAHQAPLCMGFSRQEYWSGLPFPPPGDLPDPGIEPQVSYTIKLKSGLNWIIYDTLQGLLYYRHMKH